MHQQVDLIKRSIHSLVGNVYVHCILYTRVHQPLPFQSLILSNPLHNMLSYNHILSLTTRFASAHRLRTLTVGREAKPSLLEVT